MGTIGIYKYENKTNGKIYIGLSSNIEQRYNQHLTASRVNEPVMAIDAAIKKYGIDNFSFEIVEVCQESELDEREIYWIAYYNSQEEGYNNTSGGRSLRGENHPRAILSEKDVWELREMYGQKIKRSVAFEPYLKKGISHRSLLKVWNNENWTTVHTDVYTEENKAFHKKNCSNNTDQKGTTSLDRAIKQEEIDAMLKDYQSGMTINAIAKKYNKDNGTVQKYIASPTAIQEVKYRGRKVKNIETGTVFKSINSAAKWAKCGATTLTRHLYTDKVAGVVPETGKPAHWEELL